MVNTASKCGFTPQFEALEALHAKYKGEGFAVLGFPSGDFMAQEFEDEKQIQEFCTLTYGVKFPMFEKVHVKGERSHAAVPRPGPATGEAPKWNFHKYLIGRDGRVLASFGSKTRPDDKAVVAAIEAALKAPQLAAELAKDPDECRNCRAAPCGRDNSAARRPATAGAPDPRTGVTG